MRTVVIVVTSLVLAAAPFVVQARMWCIRVDGSGDAPTVQAALDSSAHGDTVAVAAGTYLENIILGKGVKLLGGFSDDFVVRDPSSLVTTLDGCGLGTVMIISNTSGADPLIDGFTISHGLQTGGWGAGGIACFDSSPTVSTCRIISNVGAPEPLNTYGAGGIACADHTSPQIIDCEITGNTSSHGPAGVLIWRSAATVNECDIHDNDGVGIHITYPEPSFVLSSNRIKGNGGAGIYCYEGSGTITRNVLSHNTHGIILSGPNCNVSVRSNTIVECDSTGIWAFETSAAAVSVTRNISVGNDYGVMCYGSSPALECNDSWANNVEDFSGDCAGVEGENGNFSADPLFCDQRGGDYRLNEDSPCVRGLHPDGYDCGRIGALGVACGPVSVEQTTWGRLKVMYR